MAGSDLLTSRTGTGSRCTVGACSSSKPWANTRRDRKKKGRLHREAPDRVQGGLQGDWTPFNRIGPEEPLVVMRTVGAVRTEYARTIAGPQVTLPEVVGAQRGRPRVSEVSESAMTSDLLRKIFAWREPPNWSRQDWREEIKAEAIAAECEAERDFDSSLGVPLGAFIGQRILARALTRYRREWAYGRRCRHASLNRDLDGISHSAEWVADESESSRHFLHQMSDHDRRLIECLFWEGRTEVQAARELRCSQAAINQSKHRILAQLRRRMSG
jgi:DNA-directed RNA polymerase specialized sigma24 family protein